MIYKKQNKKEDRKNNLKTTVINYYQKLKTLYNAALHVFHLSQQCAMGFIFAILQGFLIKFDALFFFLIE